MNVNRFTIEDAYRELNSIVGVVAVTTNATGGLTVEHKDVREEIEAVLEETIWGIVNTTDRVGQYPLVDVAPEEGNQ